MTADNVLPFIRVTLSDPPIYDQIDLSSLRSHDRHQFELDRIQIARLYARELLNAVQRDRAVRLLAAKIAVALNEARREAAEKEGAAL